MGRDAAGGVGGVQESRGGQLMMRLGRKSLLLIAFLLLTSAATADFEEAWVLWRHAAAGPEGLEEVLAEVWHPMLAFQNKEECERMVMQLAPSGFIREYRWMPSGERAEMATILHCFPEKRN